MLRPLQPWRRPAGARLDGVSSLTILLLAGLAAGLLVAGYLAVYDYSTPAVETPVVVILAVVFAAVMGLNVLAAAVRHLNRR